MNTEEGNKKRRGSEKGEVCRQLKIICLCKSIFWISFPKTNTKLSKTSRFLLHEYLLKIYSWDAECCCYIKIIMFQHFLPHLVLILRLYCLILQSNCLSIYSQCSALKMSQSDVQLNSQYGRQENKTTFCGWMLYDEISINDKHCLHMIFSHISLMIY